MTHSPKRLLLTAISVIVLALAAAPMSFAGEDDPGPTQAGETQGSSNATTLATQRGPAPSSPQGSTGTSYSSNGSNGSNGSSSEVLGTSVSKNVSVSTKDTVRAKGGIQAGFGGMATEATPLWITLPGIAGVLLILGAATTLAPVLVRSRG